MSRSEDPLTCSGGLPAFDEDCCGSLVVGLVSSVAEEEESGMVGWGSVEASVVLSSLFRAGLGASECQLTKLGLETCLAASMGRKFAGGDCCTVGMVAPPPPLPLPEA